MNEDLGKQLIIIGLVIVVTGVLFLLFSKVTSLPKLPGDILIKKDNVTIYFPWVTSLIISVLLSLIFYLFFRK